MFALFRLAQPKVSVLPFKSLGAWRSLASIAEMKVASFAEIDTELSKSDIRKEAVLAAFWKMIYSQEHEARSQEHEARVENKALSDKLVDVTDKLFDVSEAARLENKALSDKLFGVSEAARLENKALSDKLLDETKNFMQQKIDLQQRSTELLALQGRLSARGVFDYIEEHEISQSTQLHGLSRFKLWEQLIQRNIGLRTCLAQESVAGTGKATQPSLHDLTSFVVSVYKTLSAHIHSNKSPAEYKNGNDKVQVVEEVLSKRQCRALECVCDAYGFPARVIMRTSVQTQKIEK